MGKARSYKRDGSGKFAGIALAAGKGRAKPKAKPKAKAKGKGGGFAAGKMPKGMPAFGKS